MFAVCLLSLLVAFAARHFVQRWYGQSLFKFMVCQRIQVKTSFATIKKLAQVMQSSALV